MDSANNALKDMLDHVFINSGNEMMYPPIHLPDIPSVVNEYEAALSRNDLPRAYHFLILFKQYLERTGEHMNSVELADMELRQAIKPVNTMPLYGAGAI